MLSGRQAAKAILEKGEGLMSNFVV
jgi:hypothetical protein